MNANDLRWRKYGRIMNWMIFTRPIYFLLVSAILNSPQKLASWIVFTQSAPELKIYGISFSPFLPGSFFFRFFFLKEKKPRENISSLGMSAFLSAFHLGLAFRLLSLRNSRNSEFPMLDLTFPFSFHLFRLFFMFFFFIWRKHSVAYFSLPLPLPLPSFDTICFVPSCLTQMAFSCPLLILSVCLSVPPSVCLSICLFVCHSVSQAVFLSVSLSPSSCVPRYHDVNSWILGLSSKMWDHANPS